MSPIPNDTAARRAGLVTCLAALLGFACAANASTAQLTLRWSDTSANEHGFRIERATSAAGPFEEIATTPAGASSFVDDALGHATTYHYRILAFNHAGDSGYSNIASGTTPPPPNTAPSISPIANQTIAEDGATPALAFTVSDTQTPASDLVVRATSGNTTLVPQGNLTLAGTGSNRTLSVRPATNLSGTVPITIEVSDGALASTATFTVAVTAVNDAPTISAIADRAMQAGTSSGTIAFTIGDVDTSTGSLTVSAASSNATLIPSANLVLGGTGASRTLAFSTPATSGGSVVVTVRVSDGAATASSAFTVTLAPANTPPTISSIAAQTVLLNSASPALDFSVADAQTAAAALVVTATSSNTSVIPAGGITLGGSGTSRTITVRPAANVSGSSSTITVRVSDGSLSSTTSFIVTVPANTAPTISPLPDQTVPTGTTRGPIPFTVADTETPAADLVVTAISANPTLLPDSAIVVAGSGANRSISVAPPSSPTGGSATVTVRVGDGLLLTTASFVVTVDATNVAPTITAIPNQSIAMNDTAGPLAFTVQDTQTPAANLTLITNASNQALIPLSNITLGGSGANRTITVRPLSNTTGWSTIWVKVSDGTLTQTTSFVVNVSASLTYADVGSPVIAGSQTVTGSTITITAGGTDIWGSSDQFRFGYHALEGDSEMTVRLASLTNSHASAKAGLMYRTTTAADSAYVYLCVTPAGNLSFQYRATAGAYTSQKAARPGMQAPRWLKLTRSGDTFYAFHSPDGVSWDLLEFVTVDLPDSVPAGLAVCSRAESTATTATFEGFSID